MHGTSTVTWFISLPCDQCAWARWTADLQGNQHQDSKEFSELQSVRGMWFTPTPQITTPTENLNPLSNSRFRERKEFGFCFKERNLDFASKEQKNINNNEY